MFTDVTEVSQSPSIHCWHHHGHLLVNWLCVNNVSMQPNQTQQQNNTEDVCCTCCLLNLTGDSFSWYNDLCKKKAELFSNVGLTVLSLTFTWSTHVPLDKETSQYGHSTFMFGRVQKSLCKFKNFLTEKNHCLFGKYPHWPSCWDLD